MIALLTRLVIPATLILAAVGLNAMSTSNELAIEGAQAGGFNLVISQTRGEDSPHLTIQKDTLEFTAKGPWPETLAVKGGFVTPGAGEAEPRDFQPPLLKGSKYIQDLSGYGGPSGRILLAVEGKAFAPNPGALRVFSLDGGRLSVLLADDTFRLDAIADLDHDGLPELIGYRSLWRIINSCMTTYAPWTVYRQASPSAAFRVAPGLSKAYAKSQGYPWGGPNAREDVGVSICGTHGQFLTKPPQP